MSKLHLVFGGRVKDPRTLDFDEKTIEVVGSGPMSSQAVMWAGLLDSALKVTGQGGMETWQDAFAPGFPAIAIQPRAQLCGSLDSLRKQEDEKGFRERSYKAEKFFRVGKADQWKSALSKAQVDRVVEQHKEQMERFGYWPL